MGLFTVNTKRAWNQDQNIEEQVCSSKVVENTTLKPIFLKEGKDVSQKVYSKVHFGQIKLSDLNKSIMSSDFKLEEE